MSSEQEPSAEPEMLSSSELEETAHRVQAAATLFTTTIGAVATAFIVGRRGRTPAEKE